MPQRLIHNNTMQPTPHTSGGKHKFNDVKKISALTTQKSSQNLWPIFKKKSRQQKSFKVQLRDQSGNVEAHAKENVDPYYEQLKENQTHFKQDDDTNNSQDSIRDIFTDVNKNTEEENLTDYLQVGNCTEDCETVVEDETENEEDKSTDVLQDVCESTYDDRGNQPKTDDEDKNEESPSQKVEDTSDCDVAVMESDDDEYIIINKQARKGAKRCIESEDEASSDDDTIIYDCSETFPLATSHEPSCDAGDLNDLEDVPSPRKKKKYSRIQAPLESSLETEYSEYIDDDDDDDDDDDENETTSQSSYSSDGSESDTDSDSSADEQVEDEFDELNDDLYHDVWKYIYYLVMKAIGQEEEVKLLSDIMKSVRSVEDNIQAHKMIGESCAWDHTFKEYLERFPNYETSPDSAEGLENLTDCEACNRKGHRWAYRVTLKGYPYDENTFEENDVVDEKEYMCGQYCYERSKLYHKLYHWPYHLFKKYERKLDEMNNNPDEVMRNKQTVIRYYQKLKQILYKVDQDYLDAGRRCNKRWERHNKKY